MDGNEVHGGPDISSATPSDKFVAGNRQAIEMYAQNVQVPCMPCPVPFNRGFEFLKLAESAVVVAGNLLPSTTEFRKLAQLM